MPNPPIKPKRAKKLTIPSSNPLLNESLYSTIFNTTYELITFLSPSGHLLRVNLAALRLMNSTEPEVLGTYFWEIPFWNYSRESQKTIKAAVKSARKGHLVRTSLELITKSGRNITLDFSLEPIKNNGDIVLLLAEGRDISEKKKLDDFRKSFLSAASHELKTPITVLKLIIQSLLRKAQGDDTVTLKKDQLHEIDLELDRLTQLINDLMDSTRFETGKLSLNFEELNLSALVKQSVAKMKVSTKSHKIVLSKLPKQVAVIADKVRIEQVIFNLLSNAVKYSPPKTTIRATVTRNHHAAYVGIQDKGIGIEKKEQRLIFDRYYQVKSTKTRGFGLGLYISREIIKRHKGKIWVSSEKNKGSTFTFSLPLNKDAKKKG